MVATVDGGKVVALEGDPDHPITRGFLCSKGSRFVQRALSPERILHPLLRDDAGQWRRASWDQALDRLCADLVDARDSFGTLSVFYNYDAGSMGMLKGLDMRFWNTFGGVTLPAGSLCSSAGIAALTAHYGINTCHDPTDIPNSRMIILWGRNPAVTSIHMLPFLKQAREEGARIVVIDPVRNESASLADQVIQPRPGTDGALALAMAGVIIEAGLVDVDYVSAHVHGYEQFAARAAEMTCERAAYICGVSEDEIRETALDYASTSPASIWVGFGVQRHAGGGGAVRAIDALTVITGNVGVSGGGTNYSHRNTRRTRPLGAIERARNVRAVPRAALGPSLMSLEDPPVRSCVISRSNPLCQSPNSHEVRKALEGMDCVTVIDMFLTDTADAAQVFLPCTSFLEEEDVYMSYWHNIIAYGPALADRPGDVRSDLEIWASLAERLGFGHEYEPTPEEWIDYALEPLHADGITLVALREHGWMRDPTAPLVPWVQGKFPTPSGRIELWSNTAELWGADPLPSFIPPAESGGGDYPLTLISSQPRHRIHSQFDEVNKHTHDSGLPELRVHPDTAASRGIANGDVVVISSPRGKARFKCLHDERLRVDVVVCSNGRPVKRGGGVNFLTGDYVSDIGLQAALYDCQCELEPQP